MIELFIFTVTTQNCQAKNYLTAIQFSPAARGGGVFDLIPENCAAGMQLINAGYSNL